MDNNKPLKLTPWEKYECEDRQTVEKENEEWEKMEQEKARAAWRALTPRERIVAMRSEIEDATLGELDIKQAKLETLAANAYEYHGEGNSVFLSTRCSVALKWLSAWLCALESHLKDGEKL